jgi:hypothetical protein
MNLRKLDESIWVLERMPQLGGGLRLGARTAFFKLADGDLLVFSPVPGIEEHKQEVDALGPVRAFVEPCVMHHLGLDDARPVWPAARRFARPSLQARRPDLEFTDTLGETPDSLWAAEFDQVVVGGMPRLDEVIFFHRNSRTLVIGDLCFNMVHSDHTFTRLFMKLNGAYGHFGPSRICKALMADKRAVRVAVERMLSWNPERLLVCHGEIVETNGRAELERAFAFLPRPV